MIAFSLRGNFFTKGSSLGERGIVGRRLGAAVTNGFHGIKTAGDKPPPYKGLVGTFFERPGNNGISAPHRRVDEVKNSFVGTGVPDGPKTKDF